MRHNHKSIVTDASAMFVTEDDAIAAAIWSVAEEIGRFQTLAQSVARQKPRTLAEVEQARSYAAELTAPIAARAAEAGCTFEEFLKLAKIEFRDRGHRTEGFRTSLPPLEEADPEYDRLRAEQAAAERGLDEYQLRVIALRAAQRAELIAAEREEESWRRRVRRATDALTRHARQACEQ